MGNREAAVSRRLAALALLAGLAACMSTPRPLGGAGAEAGGANLATLDGATAAVGATLVDAASAVDGTTRVDGATTADGATAAIVVDAGNGALLDGAADAYPCGISAFQPVTVCFGSDASVYGKYLDPDAGVAPGRCPSLSDFLPSRGEGSCGYSACGPLPPGVVAGDASAGGAASCCFWVVGVCGV
jgi:hypothetical protein